MTDFALNNIDGTSSGISSWYRGSVIAVDDTSMLVMGDDVEPMIFSTGNLDIPLSVGDVVTVKYDSIDTESYPPKARALGAAYCI